MPKLTQFEDEFCQEIRTIYSVDNDNPKGAWSSITSSEMCPNCGNRHIFRFYDVNIINEYETDEAYVTVYECTCPICGIDFRVEIKMMKDEED